MKVICTDCGHKFRVTEDGGEYTPPNCPQCGKTIISVSPTPTSEEMAAQVEE